MVAALPLPVLVAIFAASAGVIWFAGIRLSNETDLLATRLGLGEALGGLLLLAFATNLPEIAITVSAALRGDLGIAVGNILGGIAIQTTVLAVLDALGIRGPRPLTYLASSLVLVLEGALVVSLLSVVVMGTRLPGSLIVARVDPAAVALVALWLVGVWLVGKARKGLPWHEAGNPPDGQASPRGAPSAQKAAERGVSTARAAAVFAAAAAATLAAGVAIERSGEAIASSVGMSGVLFGATVLAAATALPEVSSGLASVKLGDLQLAVSDIFGGNAFLLVLFLPAGLLSGKAVLPQAHATDVYLTALGALLTVVYIAGLIFRPKRRIARLGIDSLVVLGLYAIGIVGLVAVAHG